MFMLPFRHAATRFYLPSAAIALTIAAPGVAREDPSVFVARADEMGAAGPGTEAVEGVLFTPLAAMDPPPAWFEADRSRFVACLPGTKDWAEAEAWVNADPQRKALEALAACTETSKGTKWVLGLPYGADTVSSEWVDAGLTVTLSQDNLLATAEFPYLHRIGTLADLVTLEVYRLAAADDGEASLGVGTDLVHLGRIITDRPFSGESLFGYELMSRALLVMRDAIYTYPDAFRDQQVLLDAIKALDVKDIKNNYFRFPNGERIAAEQLMARTIAERGQVDTGKYTVTMSSMTSNERPLRRFGQADRWRQSAGLQADWFDTQKVIERIWGDFNKRWEYEFAHNEHARPTDFEQLQSPQNQMVIEVARGAMRVFPARRLTAGELGATRIALGCVAWKNSRFDWPPKTAASLPLRPNFLRYVDDDPYNWFPRGGAYQPFKYFVPIRDEERTEREDPHPHKVVASISDAHPYESAFNQAAGMTGYGGTLTAMREVGRGPASTRSEDLGSDIAENDTASSIVGELRAYYDLNTRQIDPKRYREYLENRGAAQTRTRMQILAIVLKGLDNSITPGSVNWDSVVDRIMSMVPPNAPANASLRNALTQVGIDAGLYKQTLVAQYTAVMADPLARPGIAKILDGATPTPEDNTNMERALVDIMSRQDLLDIEQQVTEQFLAGPLGGSVRAVLTAQAANFTVFSALLDDSEFVLYSIGPDRYDNRARNVGAEGDDILYWPPLISLYRRSMN